MTPSPTPSLAGQALELADTIVSDGCCAHWKEAVLLLRQFAAAIPALPPDTGKQAKLPRELMESYLANASEETFDGFRNSVAAKRVDRFTEMVYRMGFESGWRIREECLAASQPAPTHDAAPLSIEDAVALVRAKANAGYGYGPKGSRDEFDRCYSLSPLQLATVINAARAASMQDTSSPQSPQGGA